MVLAGCQVAGAQAYVRMCKVQGASKEAVQNAVHGAVEAQMRQESLTRGTGFSPEFVTTITTSIMQQPPPEQQAGPEQAS